MAGEINPLLAGPRIEETNRLDTVAHVGGMVAMVGGVLNQASSYIKGLSRIPVFAPNSLLHRTFGVVGMAAMVCSVLSSSRRLLKSNETKDDQKKFDWIVLIGGLFTFSNIGLSLVRGVLHQNLTREGVAFIGDHMARLNGVQNLFVAGNTALDLYGTKLVYDQYRESPSTTTGSQLLLQGALSLVFGFDRQARGALTGLFRPEDQAAALGRRIGSELRSFSERFPEYQAVLNDPFSSASLCLKAAQCPDSIVFRGAEAHRGVWTGDPGRQKAVRNLYVGLSSLNGLTGNPVALERSVLDGLVREILRHAKERGVRIKEADLRRAEEMAASILFQKFVIEHFPAAGRRLGPEWEFQPARDHSQPIGSWKDSPRAVPEYPAFSQTWHLEKIGEALRQNGWDIEYQPVQPPGFGGVTRVYAVVTGRFSCAGKTYTIQQRQTLRDTQINVWEDGQRIKIDALYSGRVTVPQATLLAGLKANVEGAVEQIAARIAVDRKEIWASIQQTDGIQYPRGKLRIGNSIHDWTYETDTRRVRFNSLELVQGDTRTPYMPGTYSSYDDAYLALEQFISRKDVQGIGTERYSAVVAKKGGRELKLSMTYDGVDDYELQIDNFRNGGLDDELLGTVAGKLREIGVESTYHDNLVSQQVHVETDDDFDSLIQATRLLFSHHPLIQAGMPPHPFRSRFIRMPEVPVGDYPGGDPGLPVRQRDAVRRILGNEWDLRVGEGPVDRMERVSQDIYRLFADHEAAYNLDNALQWYAHNSGLPPDSERAKALVAGTRAKRGTPIRTAEMRVNNMPEEYNADDELVLSPGGLLWQQRFWAGLFEAARSPGSLTATERGCRFEQASERSLRRFLGEG